MTVRCQGRRGGGRRPSRTRRRRRPHRGTPGALSRSSRDGRRRRPATWPKTGGVPGDLAVDRLRVRVDQQLVRVEAMARARARTGRARGSRRADRARRPARSRARRSRSSRAARCARLARRPRRTGRARPARRPRRTRRSWRRAVEGRAEPVGLARPERSCARGLVRQRHGWAVAPTRSGARGREGGQRGDGHQERMVGDTGLEPVTSCMSSKCSNQLS